VLGPESEHARCGIIRVARLVDESLRLIISAIPPAILRYNKTLIICVKETQSQSLSATNFNTTLDLVRYEILASSFQRQSVFLFAAQLN
jgi:hypothetical protein